MNVVNKFQETARTFALGAQLLTAAVPAQVQVAIPVIVAATAVLDAGDAAACVGRDAGCNGPVTPTPVAPTTPNVVNNNPSANAAASSNASAVGNGGQGGQGGQGGTGQGGQAHNGGNTNKINNVTVFGGAAAAAAAGCSVVDGFNLGAGVAGFGITGSWSNANKDFFILCNNYEQVNTILRTDLCIGLPMTAIDTGQENYSGNPMTRAYLASNEGAARFSQTCNYKVDSVVRVQNGIKSAPLPVPPM